ncbi:hypothetical protein L6452_30267 [Arctium lappa]|uniref:Uncharacterized protein n=1 Tax=Arctium lappa TaxID=4217 RepID=A0ACB8ZHW7_ARCLA|nr:hypothetical protein L6452_30267 [Arctium lappa]
MSSELSPPPPQNRFKTLSKFKRMIRESMTSGTGSKSSSNRMIVKILEMSMMKRRAKIIRRVINWVTGISTKGDGREIKGDEDRAKLAERFYEIEAERRNRIQRCGWPEATNTWEPMENLSSIPNGIEAFELKLEG